MPLFSPVRPLVICALLVLLSSCQGKGRDSTEAAELQKKTAEIAPQDSLAYYQQLLHADTTHPAVLLERAKYHLRHQAVELAKKDLETILSKDSTFLEAHRLYGDISLAQLDLESSKRHYTYILDTDATHTGALVGMGKIYAALNHSTKAIFYLGEALKANPYLPEPYFVKGLIYRADYYQTGREESWKRAMGSFQTAVEQAPDYYAAYIEMGVMYAEKNDSIAIEYYDAALDVYPQSIEAWYNKGMYYQSRGEVEQALRAYATINQIEPDWPNAYYNTGYIHLVMTGEVDSAIVYFEKVTQLDALYHQAYHNLALAHEKKGNLQQAKYNYSKALAIEPDFQLAKDNLAALQ